MRRRATRSHVAAHLSRGRVRVERASLGGAATMRVRLPHDGFSPWTMFLLPALGVVVGVAVLANRLYREDVRRDARVAWKEVADCARRLSDATLRCEGPSRSGTPEALSPGCVACRISVERLHTLLDEGALEPPPDPELARGLSDLGAVLSGRAALDPSLPARVSRGARASGIASP